VFSSISCIQEEGMSSASSEGEQGSVLEQDIGVLIAFTPHLCNVTS
jgi:hypothetical protein